MDGIEPSASVLSGQRSTTELRAHIHRILAKKLIKCKYNCKKRGLSEKTAHDESVLPKGKKRENCERTKLDSWQRRFLGASVAGLIVKGKGLRAKS